jgi:hypothetical protein
MPGLVARGAVCATLLVLALPGWASAFGGAYLSDSSISVSHGGSAYPRVTCAPGTEGFCTGRLKISASGHGTIASVPMAIRGWDSPSVQIPLSRSALNLLIGSGGLNVKVTIRVHDTNGTWKTTTGHARMRAP